MYLPSRSIKQSKLHTKTGGLMNFSDYKKKRHVASYIAFIVVLVMFAILALAPVFWLLVSSFKTVFIRKLNVLS